MLPPPAIHGVRVRHGVACVRAARLWADRQRPASDTLAEAIRRLQDIEKQLGDARFDGRPSVVRLIEASLAVAEQHIDALQRPSA
jgi:hypothetical protein